MKRAGLLLCIGLLVLIVACAGPGDEQEPATEEPAADLAARAAEIAKAIEADPDAAEEILEGHDLTVEQYEEMLYEISSDPELSRAYQEALVE